VHKVALVWVEGHADLGKEGLCLLECGIQDDAVLRKGVGDGEEGQVVDVRAGCGGEADGGGDGVVGQLADDWGRIEAGEDR